MILTIPPNKIYDSEQEVKFTKNLITLIGENGSGKSAILEKIFADYLQDNTKKVICFASGQNETYSTIYADFLKSSRNKLIRNSFNSGANTIVQSFYFDPNWARVLIFFATALKPNGYARNLLNEKGLVEGDQHQEDVSSVLNFSFRVLRDYANRIQEILKAEERGGKYKSIRKTIPHEKLEKLIEATIDPEYNFNRLISKRRVELFAKDIRRIFDSNVDEIFTFLWYVTYHGIFIDLGLTKLTFKSRLELNDLSDGEFMLLSFYALIDLFDSPDTLFLLDEIDSHLYYENVVKLWEVLHKVKGKVITTTHSADSIVQNEFDQICLVENGKVIQETVAEMIMDRLSVLTLGETYKYRIASKVRFLALLENYFDWFVFVELCKRKIQGFNIDKFERIHFVKCSSGYNQSAQVFGLEKRRWVEDFIKVNGKKNVMTRMVFSICDRDNLPLTDMKDTGIAVTGEASRIIKFGPTDRHEAHFLCWKRREIENYLLSFSLLTATGKLEEVNNCLAPVNQIRKDSPCDNDDVRTKDLKAILQPLYLRDDMQSIGRHEEGVDYVKLQRLIDLIPPSEISEDIEKMYQFIISKID